MRANKPLIALLAATLLMGSAVAKPGWGGDRDGYQGRGFYGLQQLDLSDEQKTQIEALLEQAKQQRQAQRDAMRSQQQTFMSNPEFDNQTAEEMMAQREQQREANRLAQMQLQHEIYQLLTAEQQQQLQQVQDERPRRGKKGMRKGQQRFGN